jgi:hypothetical protein
MRSLFTFALVAVVAVFLASSTAPAATISSGVDDHGNHFLTLDGPIAAGDPDHFAAAIQSRMQRKHKRTSSARFWSRKRSKQSLGNCERR